MNFQNIPRENKTIKRAFVPKLDYVFYFDYEQIEYRLLAYYFAVQLGDNTMSASFKQGIDPHVATGKLMLGIGDRDLTDSERQVGKTGNFSVMYAGGAPTIMRQLKCSEERARELLKRLHEALPVKELQKEIQEVYAERGYVKTIAGRHLVHDPKIERTKGLNRAKAALLNYIIQGSAAELMRDALRNVHTGLRDYESHMVNVVHDELAVDTRAKEAEVVAKLVPSLMGNEQIEEVVPIGVSVEVTETNWADKEPLKEVA